MKIRIGKTRQEPARSTPEKQHKPNERLESSREKRPTAGEKCSCGWRGGDAERRSGRRCPQQSRAGSYIAGRCLPSSTIPTPCAWCSSITLGMILLPTSLSHDRWAPRNLAAAVFNSLASWLHLLRGSMSFTASGYLHCFLVLLPSHGFGNLQQYRVYCALHC